MNSSLRHPSQRETSAADHAPAITLEGLCAEIAQRNEEFTKQRFVSLDIIDKLKKVGIYRMSTPKCFGGDALAPTSALRVLERISQADGSAGWVATFGAANMYLSVLPRETQAKLYAKSPDLVFAGGLYPQQPAVRVDQGWRVNGTWKFASGCKGAEVLGVGIITSDDDRSSPKPRVALMPAGQVEIVDNWEVMGLEGTGSHDLRVRDVYVPDEWTFIRGGTPVIDEPLFRYPIIPYAAQLHAIVNLGIARAALDEIAALAHGKVAITGAAPLTSRPYIRSEIAKAEARLGSARALFYEATESAWEAVCAGDPVSTKQASMIRLATVEAARGGAAAVQTAYLLAGTTAIFLSHPLQRYLRNAMVVTQHAFLNDGVYDSAGAVTLGLDHPPGFF